MYKIDWKREDFGGVERYKASVLDRKIYVQKKDPTDGSSQWVAIVSMDVCYEIEGSISPISAGFDTSGEAKNRVALAAEGMAPLVFGIDRILIGNKSKWDWVSYKGEILT